MKYTNIDIDAVLRGEPVPWSILTIARCLSRIPRWCGNTTVPYSVAAHSVHVSTIAEAEALRRGVHSRTVNECARWGLLHDAEESVFGDIPEPVRKHFEPKISEMQAVFHRSIATHFGCDIDDPTVDAVVTFADQAARNTEARDVRWDKRELSPIDPNTLVLPGNAWSYCAFLARFDELFWKGWG